MTITAPLFSCLSTSRYDFLYLNLKNHLLAATTLKKHYPPITLGSPGEEIGSKDLHAIIQRFKNLNQYRLQSVQNFLQSRQRVFLQLLPLIFHQNHPLLPGFISTETPSGIPDYSPGKTTIQAAKQFSKSYRYSRKALGYHAIDGIFLMGSVGSIAFSRTSDMDIWLCHATALNAAEIDELQLKAEAVEKWAQSLNLEVHFFLMDSEQFRRGVHTPISSESSGQTQHYLLLEEFYRTAIYVAGKVPAWWVVPPHQEENYSDYVNHLLVNRFISPLDIIDFGGLEAVPAEEFISATLWHIYKSLSSPYKSLLKLFLMECYASEYPQPQWISSSLKQAIYQGEFDIDKLDPYLLIYEKVEEYLHLVASQRRLALSRQCFYLKIMGDSPRSLDPTARALRENYLQAIARQWRWPGDLLSNFSRHRYWDIHKATEEHAVIRDQLKQCLRMIVRFAGRHVEEDYRNNQDLKLIGRKLHAHLEYKPGKIEIITTRANIQKKEEELSLIQIDQEHAEPLWHVYSGYIRNPKKPLTRPVKEGEGLLEILSWIVLNGLYQNRVKLHLSSSGLKVSATEAQLILDQLQRFFSEHRTCDGGTLETYKHPNQFLTSLLFINLGETLSLERDEGQIIMSDRSDPFSYGENRLNFVRRIDRITVSSWGEVNIAKFHDAEGFFHCITELFNQCRTPITGDSLHAICHTPLRAKSIVLRIKVLFNQLIKFFATKDSNWRYILPAKNSYYLFTLDDEHLTYRKLETNDLLLQELSSTQSQYAPVYFDNHVLSNTVIPFLYAHIAPGTVQVFFHASDRQIAVYVIDEKAALFTRQHRDSKVEKVLADYYVFLHTLIDQAKLADQTQIRIFEIQKNSAGVVSCHAVKFKPQDSFLELNIRITTSPTAERNAPLTIFCNDREYSSAQTPNVFSAVKAHILAFRQDRHDYYPFHINEVDVPAHLLGVRDIKQAHAVHYLQYKQKIEARIAASGKS